MAKVLLSFILFILITAFQSKNAEKINCDNFKVNVKVENTSNGLDNGSIEVFAKGGSTPYHYLIFKKNGALENKEANISYAMNLQKGKYTCIVIDNDNCQKLINFIIK